jgi:hypothetical protein
MQKENRNKEGVRGENMGLIIQSLLKAIFSGM